MHSLETYLFEIFRNPDLRPFEGTQLTAMGFRLKPGTGVWTRKTLVGIQEYGSIYNTPRPGERVVEVPREEQRMGDKLNNC